MDSQTGRQSPADKGSGVTVYQSGAQLDSNASASKAKSLEQIQATMISERSSEIAEVNLRTNEVRVLVAANASPPPAALRRSPSGKWLSYLSVIVPTSLVLGDASYDLAVLPSDGQGSIRVTGQKLPVMTTGYDNFDAVYRWRPNKDQIAYLKDATIWMADLSTEQTSTGKQLAPELGKFATTRADRLMFSANGDFVIARRMTAEASEFVCIPLAGGGAIRHIRLDPKLTFNSVVRDTDGNLWESFEGTSYIVSKEPDGGETVVTAVNFTTGEMNPRWREPGRLEFVNLSSRARSLTALFENFSTPQNLYEFPESFVGRRALTNHGGAKERTLSGKTVSFQTIVPKYDGSLVPVRTTIILPNEFASGSPPPPAVIVAYPDAGVSRSGEEFQGGVPASGFPIEILTSRGIAAVLVDCPITPLHQRGNLLKEIPDAVMPQVYAAVEHGYVDVKRLGVMGHSFGGFTALGLITQTNLFRAAVAIAPGATDLIGSHGLMRGPGAYFYWPEDANRMGVPPWEDLLRYVTNSPYLQVDRVHTPVLILQGDKDSSASAQETEKIFNEFKRLNHTAELAVYRGEGHSPMEWSEAARLDGAERMIEFLRRHLVELK